MVAEGIQTVLRREGYPKPYEALKSFDTYEPDCYGAIYQGVYRTLNVSDRIKDELRAITPHNYTGI